MKRLRYIFAALLVMIGIVSCINDDPVHTDLKVGDTIPDFTVVMNDGSVLTGSGLRMGKAVIMFFNSSCPDCRNTLPSVQNIYDEYYGDVKFALISREQGGDEIASYWETQGYTMPYSPQADRNVYNLFASSRVPRVYVCKDGIIKYMYDDDPIPSYDDLKSNLQEL